MSQGGGGSGDGALLPEPQPKQAVRARTEHMAAEMLDCHACHLPLKPPIFKVRSTNQRPNLSFLAE
jgi:hypothetical protein